MHWVPPNACNASNGFPCLEKTGRAQANQVFLVANLLNSKEFLESVNIPRFCNILDFPFWISCCFLCVALSTPINFWMSLQCFWFAKIAYDFVSGETCIFLPDSLTVSYLLPLGLRFWTAAWRIHLRCTYNYLYSIFNTGIHAYIDTRTHTHIHIYILIYV